MVRRFITLKPIFSRGNQKNASDEAPASAPVREIDKKRRQRRQIVSAFSCCLTDRKPITEIRDASELPYPKMTILAALAQEIRDSDDDDRVQHLKLMAGFLADYQENVGADPLSLMGTDEEFQFLRHDTGGSFSDPLSMIERNPARERYRVYREMSERDLRHIHSHLAGAEESRSRAAQTAA